MLTKPEHLQRAMKNANACFDEAWEKYMSDVRPEIAQEAIETLIDGCRKLLAIAKYQQRRIDELEAKKC